MQEFERSLDCYLRAIVIETELGNQWGIAYHQAGAADVLLAKGDEEAALGYYDQALPVLLAHGAPYYALAPLLSKAELLYGRGDRAAARALNEQALALATELDLPDFASRGRVLAAKLDGSEEG
jgi:tetratricopeptide (TPR) repeat protein